MYLNSIDRMKVKQFVIQNYDNFTPNIRYFFDNIYDATKSYSFDAISQIYAYLFPEKYINLYRAIFIEFLKSKFPDLTARQIIEVASGYIPIVSMYLQRYVGVLDGITCIDKMALPVEVPGVQIEKRMFQEDTDVSRFNLLLSFLPCESFDVIVPQIVNNRMEACIQTCRCNHGVYSETPEAFEKYISGNVGYLRVLERYGFVVECEKVLYDEPIITVRKRIQ